VRQDFVPWGGGIWYITCNPGFRHRNPELSKMAQKTQFFSMAAWSFEAENQKKTV
jgi:hypothetical protein